MPQGHSLRLNPPWIQDSSREQPHHNPGIHFKTKFKLNPSFKRCRYNIFFKKHVWFTTVFFNIFFTHINNVEDIVDFLDRLGVFKQLTTNIKSILGTYKGFKGTAVNLSCHSFFNLYLIYKMHLIFSLFISCTLSLNYSFFILKTWNLKWNGLDGVPVFDEIWTQSLNSQIQQIRWY